MEPDAETVIADFLGDIRDRHERIGGGFFAPHTTEDYRLVLRPLAQILLADLAENGIGLTS